MADTIKFLKTRDVKPPTRANAYDAGIDFYVPELTEDYVRAVKEKNPQLFPIFIRNVGIELHPQKRILLPSGFHCQMSSPGRALIAANKSGVSTKNGLVYSAQVVDFEYQGEIHLGLINTGDSAVTITSGMKILQFVETPVFNSDIEIEEGKTTNEFYEKTTDRAAKGFGSSDV